MCCRYSVKRETNLEAFQLLGINPRFVPVWNEKTVTPGGSGLLVFGDNKLLTANEAIWGFPGKDKSLVINARAESALVKPMFSSSLQNRRCILPASCFYEWDSEKNKYTFKDSDKNVIYLAGFWNMIDDVMRFVVLTTAANESMIKVHDRMPLMMDINDVEPWIFNDKDAEKLLTKEMPMLTSSCENEQISMF